MKPNKKYDITLSTIFKEIDNREVKGALKAIDLKIPARLIIEQRGAEFYINQLFKTNQTLALNLACLLCRNLIRVYIIEANHVHQKKMFGVDIADECVKSYKKAYEDSFFFGQGRAKAREMSYNFKKFVDVISEANERVFIKTFPADQLQYSVAEHEQGFNPEILEKKFPKHCLVNFLGCLKQLCDMFSDADLNADSMINQMCISLIEGMQ